MKQFKVKQSSELTHDQLWQASEALVACVEGPSVSRSSFVLDTIIKTAEKSKDKIVYVTDQSPGEVAVSLLSTGTGLDKKKNLLREFDNFERERLKLLTAQLAGKVYVSESLNIFDCFKECLEVRSKERIALLVIEDDFLGRRELKTYSEIGKALGVKVIISRSSFGEVDKLPFDACLFQVS